MLTEQTPPKRESFWRRQFSPIPTRPQINFDIVAGVVLPLLCLIFDPVVFRGDPDPCLGTPLLSRYTFFAYCAIGSVILTLLIWLILGSRIKRGLGLMAGILFAGALFSIGFGAVLLLWSIFGLLICFCIIGLIPFLTACIYLRNGIRVVRYAREQKPSQRGYQLAATSLTGLFIVIVIPALVQWQAPRFFPQPPVVQHDPQACYSASE